MILRLELPCEWTVLPSFVTLPSGRANATREDSMMFQLAELLSPALTVVVVLAIVIATAVRAATGRQSARVVIKIVKSIFENPLSTTTITTSSGHKDRTAEPDGPSQTNGPVAKVRATATGLGAVYQAGRDIRISAEDSHLRLDDASAAGDKSDGSQATEGGR